MDDENSNKSGKFLSFDIIMLQQVQIINNIASKELTRGYWDTRTRGDVVEFVRVEDGRTAFINAVKMLKQGFVGDEDIQINKILEDFNKKYEGKDVNKFDDTEREDLILEKLVMYNKIYTILLKQIRLKAQTQIVYIEIFK